MSGCFWPSDALQLRPGPIVPGDATLPIEQNFCGELGPKIHSSPPKNLLSAPERKNISQHSMSRGSGEPFTRLLPSPTCESYRATPPPPPSKPSSSDSSPHTDQWRSSTDRDLERWSPLGRRNVHKHAVVQSDLGHRRGDPVQVGPYYPRERGQEGQERLELLITTG